MRKITDCLDEYSPKCYNVRERRESMKSKSTLLEGSIWKGMLLFAMPILLGQVFQQLYNTADAFIVGKFRSGDEYAAVTSTGSLAFLLVGFFGGIAMGAGVVVARYFGAGDTVKLRKTVHTTVIFGICAGLFLSVLGVLATPILLRWMDTPPEILPYSVQYFRFYFAGILATVMYNLCMGILRAVGDSKSPLYYLILSSVINIILDLLFIAVCGWGVWAVALATTISQFLSMFLCMMKLFRTNDVYRLSMKEMRIDGFHLREIIRYGLPSGIQNSIISFANVIVQTNINSFGKETVSGCGTFAKLEGFAFLPVTCFTMALTTFVSQNLGARQYDRAKKGSRFGLICAVLMAELIGALMIVFAEPLMELFIDNDPGAVMVGVKQTNVEALFFGCLALSHCLAAVLRGAGKPMIPMFVMLGAWCVLRVAYISVLVPMVGESWVIFSAYPVTWTVSSIIYLIFYFKSDWLHGFEKKESKKLAL